MPPQASPERIAFSPTWEADDGAGNSEPPMVMKPQGESNARTVKFSALVKIRPIIHRRDMSTDEINSAWMNRYDKRETRKVIDSTIFLMKTGAGAMLTEDDYFCSRGLEHLVDYTRTERIKTSLKITLAMQRVLRRSGAHSPEMIARAYRAYAFKSQRAAYRKAMNDREACR